MNEAFSIPRNTIKTLILFVVCGFSAIASVVVGIDDNPPGETILADLALRPTLALTMLAGILAGILSFCTGSLAIAWKKNGLYWSIAPVISERC